MHNATESNSSSTSSRFDHQLRRVEQIVLASMFVLAVISNALVLIVMLRMRSRRTTRMVFFILHLTIADLLVAFCSVLPMLIWKTVPEAMDGPIVCRLISYLMLMATYVSVYTLVAMAIDRYQAIVHPLSIYSWTQRTGLIHMASVWCLSLLLALPQLSIFGMATSVGSPKATCRATFLAPEKTWELIYISYTSIVQFALPVCILIYCYGSIYAIVNRSFAIYRLSDSARTMSMINLPKLGVPKNLSNLSSSTVNVDRPGGNARKAHVRIHYPSVDCSSTSNVTFHKTPSLMYPVVFRLRRPSLDMSAHPSSMSLDGQRLQQRYGASHFLSRARLKTIKLTFIVVLAYVLCSAPFYVGLIIMVVSGDFLSKGTVNWLVTIFSLLLNLNSCANPIICLTLSSTLFRRKRDDKQPVIPSRKSQSNPEKRHFVLKNRKSSTKRLLLL